MLNKVLAGLGMLAVLGLMTAGVVYAVNGAGSDEVTRQGSGRGWQTSDGGVAGADVEDGDGGRWQASGIDGLGGPWAAEAAAVAEGSGISGELVTVSGVVQSLDGSLMVLGTDGGDPIEVSLGRSGYWEAQGVSLVPGDAVVVEGYYEEGDTTLAASSVTLTVTGRTIVLRDASGRPMWAGGWRGGGTGSGPAL